MENILQGVTSRTRYLLVSFDVHMRLCSVEEQFLKHSYPNHAETYQEPIHALLHTIRTKLISNFLRPRHCLSGVSNAWCAFVMSPCEIQSDTTCHVALISRTAQDLLLKFEGDVTSIQTFRPRRYILKAFGKYSNQRLHCSDSRALISQVITKL